jgi:hypothetical protein
MRLKGIRYIPGRILILKRESLHVKRKLWRRNTNGYFISVDTLIIKTRLLWNGNSTKEKVYQK